MKRPRIGITTAVDHNNIARHSLKSGYAEGIIRAGGVPILIPNFDEVELTSEYVKICDAFVIIGGNDVDARFYREENLQFNGEIEPGRDELEINLIQKALKLNKPILGICRGLQIMNVALGGTLYQDIFTQVGTKCLKHIQQAPRWHGIHEISIEKTSKLFDIFKQEKLSVNSTHHQAVKDIGNDGIIVARTSDEIIEAVEWRNFKFAIGVQWHPEAMWEKEPIFLKIFEALIESVNDN